MFKYQDMIIIITLIACTVCVYIYLVYLRKVMGQSRFISNGVYEIKKQKYWNKKTRGGV